MPGYAILCYFPVPRFSGTEITPCNCEQDERSARHKHVAHKTHKELAAIAPKETPVKMSNQSDKTKGGGRLSNPSYKDLMARKLQMSRQMTTKKNESLPDKKEEEEEDVDPCFTEYVHVAPTVTDVENQRGDNVQETHSDNEDVDGGSIISAMTLSGASSIACNTNITEDILNAKIPSTIIGKKINPVTATETEVVDQEASSKASSDSTKNNESHSLMDPSLVEIPDEWYDRSAFEAMEALSTENKSDQNTNSDSNTPVEGECDAEQATTTKEKTSAGSLLQAGTIAAGAVGLALMLLFPGGSRSEKKEKSCNAKNKKADQKPTSLRCGRQDQARSRASNKGNLLFSDW